MPHERDEFWLISKWPPNPRIWQYLRRPVLNVRGDTLKIDHATLLQRAGRWRSNGEAATIRPWRRSVPARVSVRDSDGVTHTVEVTAATLYEAAAQAVAAFEQEGWASEALTTAAVLDVEVISPSVHHRVPMSALRKWLAGLTTSPRAQAIKQSLRSRR